MVRIIRRAFSFLIGVTTVFSSPLLFAQTNTFPSSGNVGIGTTSPNVPLVVQDNDNNWLKTLLLNNTNTGTNAQAGIQMTQGSNTGYIFEQNGILWLWNASGPLFFATDNTVRMIVEAGGNVGIGTGSPSSKLHVGGDVTVDGNISANGNIAAKYQDIAEWVPSDQPLPSGTVVILNSEKTNSVIASKEAYDTRVAGVVSPNPGLVLGEAAANKLKIATVGRVKVRATASSGEIHVGDLLVSSDRPGLAMRSEPIDLGGRKIHQPGTLIGKALEPLAEGEGEILVLLSLQ